MKLSDMERKILVLIEEYSEEAEDLTDDPDLAAKRYDVINQVMFELARIRKLPKYIEMPVVAGQVVTFADLSQACGSKVYQIDTVRGVDVSYRAGGTVLKFLQGGNAEVDCFVFPKRITTENASEYELDLPEDLLEILPYGVAADMLKSDESSEYGSVYADRYELMKRQLDPRYHTGSMTFDGGVVI